jgi:hypothetical protein
MSLDNIEVVEAPACAAPSTLTATNMTATAADLGWTSADTLFDVEWGATGFTATGTPTSAGTTGVANPFNLTGLTAVTAYDYYVRANCGGSGTSTWSGPFTFTTPCVAMTAPFTVGVPVAVKPVAPHSTSNNVSALVHPKSAAVAVIFVAVNVDVGGAAHADASTTSMLSKLISLVKPVLSPLKRI